jgi:hypothetical protein
MPLSITNTTGDGVNDIFVQTTLELPDSGTSVTISGTVKKPGLSAQSVTGSPLTMPSAPGSGSIFWNVQVDLTSGAATVQQSTSADPPPINGNNFVVFRQTLVPGNTDPATVATDQTPDTY